LRLKTKKAKILDIDIYCKNGHISLPMYQLLTYLIRFNGSLMLNGCSKIIQPSTFSCSQVIATQKSLISKCRELL